MWQDAGPFLWHSRLSAALNLKLLHPREVIEAAINAWRKQRLPLASVEGFVRQVLGWREFIRGVYWLDMPQLATANHYSHVRQLPVWYWTGDTQMNCLRQTIRQTLDYGYAHHIQRLMVTGLFGLLAEIDPRPFEVALAQAEGQMARDRALLENARVDLERYRTLVRQDAASTQQLDTQKALVRQYEGIVQADMGLVESARLQLSWTRITAPLSGRLGMRLVDPGNLVRANDATGLVTITQIRPIGVSFALPERDLPAVLKRQRAGERMTVQALDRDRRRVLASGVLTTIDNQIDTATGTLRMKAEFANEDAALFPNQFVNVRLSVDTLPGAIVVPSAAIQRGSRGTFVYVVGDGERAVLRPVSTGPEHRESTVIEAGVEAGERVVVDGVDNLREGTRVEAIVKGEAERAAAEAAQPGPGAPDGSR